MNPSGQNQPVHRQEGQNFLNDLHAATSPLHPTSTLGGVGSSSMQPVVNREYRAQNLGNNLNNTNHTAASILAGHDATPQSNIFTSGSDPQAQMSAIAAAVQSNAASSSAPAFASNLPAAGQPAANTAPTEPAAQYLDELAAQDKKMRSKSKFLSGKMLIIGGAAVVLVIVLIIAAAVNNVHQAPTQSALALGTDLTNLQTLVKYGQSNGIATPNTVKVMTETGLIALSRQNDLAKVFTLTTSSNNSSSKPSFVADLDAAKASSDLDTVFTQTLGDQLNSVYLALQSLDKQTTSANGKAAIAKAMNDIKELYQRLTATS